MRFELPDGLPFLWQYRPMESVCSRITSGGTPSRREEKYYGGDINWVKTQELLDRKIFDTDEKISLQGLNNSSAKLLPKDTVLLAMYGATVGKLGILGKESTCNQACCAFICDPKVTDYRFLYYCLLGNRSNLAGLATGAAQQNLSSQQLKAVEFAFPPLEYQKEIANLLSALDDRIDHNRALAANLEAIARRLFKSWFVDFDPVRAKAAGEKPPGLADDIAALFPDRFVESELGEIPEGWSDGRLSDLVELKYGKALKATERCDGKVPVYGSGGITGWHDEALVEHPTVIVGRKGSVGTLYWEDRPSYPIDTTFFVTTKTAPLTFCYYAMLGLGLEVLNTDAAVPGLNRDNAYRQTIVIPPPDMLAAWDSFAGVLRENLRLLRDENDVLTQLRDLLLPRLISGKLRVSEAEEAIAEVMM